MIEWPLIFLGGLLGSSHCIGMCGPLALAVGGQARVRQNLARQLVFSGGRVFTYATLGAAAGYGGFWLRNKQDTLVDVQAWLAVVAGVILIVLGLVTTGLIPRRVVKSTAAGCFAGAWLSTFLRAPGWTNAFLAGLFTGFIPCGLVYGFIAVAASSGAVATGAATMILFGLGTIPLMVLAGCGGSLLRLSTRTRVLKIAAWCVVVTGCISVARGVTHLDRFGGQQEAECPFCE